MTAAVLHCCMGGKRAILDHRGWPLTCVGVAGFEPTTSSSRTRSSCLGDMGRWLYWLVHLLVFVGLKCSGLVDIARSSPRFLPRVRPHDEEPRRSRGAGRRPGRSRWRPRQPVPVLPPPVRAPERSASDLVAAPRL